MQAGQLVEDLLKRNAIFYRRLCVKFIDEHSRVEDCLQEGIRKFLECGREFSSEAEGEKYLCALLKNHFIDELRVLNRQRRIEIPESVEHEFFVDPDPLAEQQLENGQRQARHDAVMNRVWRKLELLPPYQRELIHLLFLKEPPVSIQEISRLKRIPVSTLRSRLKAAMGGLRCVCREFSTEKKKKKK